MNCPYFGRVVWSDYFKSRLVVVRHQDDDNWWFLLERDPRRILKARTKLSLMGDA